MILFFVDFSFPIRPGKGGDHEVPWSPDRVGTGGTQEHGSLVLRRAQDENCTQENCLKLQIFGELGPQRCLVRIWLLS